MCNACVSRYPSISAREIHDAFGNRISLPYTVTTIDKLNKFYNSYKEADRIPDHFPGRGWVFAHHGGRLDLEMR